MILSYYLPLVSCRLQKLERRYRDEEEMKGKTWKVYIFYKKLWDTLQSIYGGDTIFLREKSKSLRGKFDEMIMIEGEIIAQ